MKVLQNNNEVMEVKFEEQEGKKAFWHTSAHVLAQAVKRLYPETKCAIGPAIENGLYYDFDFGFPFSDEHLSAIEEEMRKIVKESLSLQVSEKSREEAIAYMEQAGEPYKLELIKELARDARISFYKQGEYEEFADHDLVAVSFLQRGDEQPGFDRPVIDEEGLQASAGAGIGGLGHIAGERIVFPAALHLDHLGTLPAIHAVNCGF